MPDNSPYFDHQNLRQGVNAFLMPMSSRRVEMRVLYLPNGSAYRVMQTGEMAKNETLELAPAEWKPMERDGEFNEKPFATSTFHDDDKGTMALLQAFVDLGHKLGMTPTGMADRSAEVTALRDHLEDMRTLTFHTIAAEKPPRRT